MLAALRSFGEVQLVVVPGLPNHRRWRRRLNQALSLLRNRSALEGTVDKTRIREELMRLASESPGRPIFLNHLSSACFRARSTETLREPIVYVAQNSEAESARSLSELASNPLKRWVLRREAKKIADLEARVSSKVAHVLTLTDEDAARFRTSCPVTCLPPLLELESIPSPDSKPRGDGTTVALISSFHWTPKRWNAHWVVEEVMPLVWAKQPQTRLLIAGAGADKLGIRHDSVSIEADVADIRPYYNLADVILVPDRQSSGLKFKTVQAALARKAIVSTPPGIEGTALRDGESVLVRATAEGFSEAILELLADCDYRASLGSRAEAIARDRFSHARILKLFGAFLEELQEVATAPQPQLNGERRGAPLA
jgi:glycosyltransferase involved in cell wall biosynthesis